MSSKAKKEELTYEERIEKLDGIIEKLQSDKASLSEAVALYREGVLLYSRCREELDAVKGQIKEITVSEGE